MGDLFDYCPFCNEDYKSDRYVNHILSDSHKKSVYSALREKKNNTDNCYDCIFLMVQDDIGFYCNLRLNSSIFTERFLEVRIDAEDGRYTPLRGYMCVSLNISVLEV